MLFMLQSIVMVHNWTIITLDFNTILSNEGYSFENAEPRILLSYYVLRLGSKLSQK